jgi:hypothetical protein
MKPMDKATAASITADISELEVGLKRLKVQYDMFFAGSLKKEPVELRFRIEKLIKRNMSSTMQKYAQRFHFNSLVSRFNSLAELWGKTIRVMEEGDRKNPSLAGREQMRERLVARCRIRGSAGEEPDLRRVYDKFIEARRRGNGSNDNVLSFQKFVRGISSQTQRLRKETGCAEIELRVVIRDDQVQVKASPGS